MSEINFQCGQDISSAAEMLVARAPAWGLFNEIKISAEPGDAPIGIIADYWRKCDERAAAYRASPEGIAAEERRQETRRILQGKHDALMARLPSLDWNDDVAVLDWCCAMQEPSDYIGVIVKKQTIIDEFAKHGFVPGMRTGRDYIPDSRIISHAYLIGQALDGLQSVAIHGILHKFAAEWKQRFGVWEPKAEGASEALRERSEPHIEP